MTDSRAVDFEPHIGIDLGTTNSCVALFNPDTQQVEVLNNSLGKPVTPSWVALEELSCVVGEAALNHKDYYYEVKRIIGQKIKDVKKDKTLLRHLPYDI